MWEVGMYIVVFGFVHCLVCGVCTCGMSRVRARRVCKVSVHFVFYVELVHITPPLAFSFGWLVFPPCVCVLVFRRISEHVVTFRGASSNKGSPYCVVYKCTFVNFAPCGAVKFATQTVQFSQQSLSHSLTRERS